MKDKHARVLAIIALVVIVLFLAAFIAALVDYTLLNGAIGFIALGLAVFALMIFIALKADGRGFSMTKINNEIEMEKIEKERAEKEKNDEENEQQSNDDDKSGEDVEKPEEAASDGDIASSAEESTHDGKR